VFASRGTWCSCFAAGFTCYSWWLLPPRRLGATRIIEQRKMIVSGSDRGDYDGFLIFPRWRAKRCTLVDCSWLVWLSSCVGCAAPYWGFGVWCQLAREPPSEWIATMRTSLPANKWTSVKKSLCHSFDSEVIGLHWYSFLWLIDSIGDWLIPLHGGTTIHPSYVFTFVSVAWPISIASFEGKQESSLVVSEPL
jgi:hypothetical protein